MGCTLTKVEARQLFALLGFVPGKLGEYLNDLRRQLVPASPLKSHITLLPPRVLGGSASELSRILRRRLVSIEPFEVGLGQVEVFPATGVVYLGIESGSAELRETHAALAEAEFAFDEIYPFHPHVTLAQDFPMVQSGEVAERARLLWNSWPGERSFVLDHVSFVQGVDLCTWETVSEHALNHSRRLKKV